MKIIISEEQLKFLMEKKFINEQWWFEIMNNSLGWDQGLQTDPMGRREETPKTGMEVISISAQIGSKKAALKTLISSKKTTNDLCLSNSLIKKPAAHAGEIQQFLKSVGLLETIDSNFKNLSATAAGTFLYGKKSGINTVGKLYDKLKSEGYNVGSKTVSVFTSQMAVGLSKKISDVIDSFNTWCKNSKKEIDSNILELKREIENLKSEMTKPNVKYSGGYYDQTF